MHNIRTTKLSQKMYAPLILINIPSKPLACINEQTVEITHEDSSWKHYTCTTCDLIFAFLHCIHKKLL